MRLTRATWDVLLTWLAVLYLIVYSIPAIVDPVESRLAEILAVSQWVIWSAFLADVVVGLWKSENRLNYLKTHPLEVLSVALPFLRPLRLLRLISFGGLAIQKIAVGRQFAVTVRTFLFSILIAFIAAVQVAISERGRTDANIHSFGDAVWWAMTTITTVSSGDKYPTSSEGRVLAFILMLIGISLMGVVTASVASWFVRISQEESIDT